MVVKAKRARALAVAAAGVAFALSSGTADGQTQAYWRFQERPAGAEFMPPPDNNGGPGSDLALDSSGNGNSLRTFSANTNPVYSASLPFGTVPQSGQANSTSLDFSPNEDLYCAGCGLNSVDFNQFTLEASFNVNNLARFHGLVGKDGSPVAGNPLSSLQLKVRDDTDALQIEILDGAGNPAQVQSLLPIVPGVWYNAAAVNNGSTLSLFLDDTSDGVGGYVLQGSIPLAAADGDGLFDHEGAFTVGRGFFNNNITDWTDGLIDEVRISSTALSPTQFLGVVPEPSALALLPLAALAALRRRRRGT